MKLNELQKDYVKNAIYQSRSSQTAIMESDILKLAESLGIEFKKNSNKETALDLIFSNGYEDKFFNQFAHCIDVPFYDAAKLNNLTDKQLSDLDQLSVINALTYTGHKDTTLYPLSILGFAPLELLEIWNNKNKTNFFRTRIEFENIDDVQKLINEISKLFEVENISKPYPNRENSKGCYIYLSIRSRCEICCSDATEIEGLKKQIAELESAKNKYKDFFIKHKSDDYIIESLEKKISELEANSTNNSPGGRPPKFTDQEKETIKMYRLQGKSIREIAKIFECSTGLVHKIVSNKK